MSKVLTSDMVESGNYCSEDTARDDSVIWQLSLPSISKLSV